MEEWRSEYIRHTVNPEDESIYEIPAKAISHSKKVLMQYGKGRNKSEGLLYWAGVNNGNIIQIKAVIYPQLEASRFTCEVSAESNLKVVEVIAENNLVQIAQVHSHPSTWVDHSITDDEEAAFKINGLLSIVVPVYGRKGLIPLSICGMHRFAYGAFARLDDSYIQKHFQIKKSLDCKVFDLRK